MQNRSPFFDAKELSSHQNDNDFKTLIYFKKIERGITYLATLLLILFCILFSKSLVFSCIIKKYKGASIIIDVKDDSSICIYKI